MYGIFPVYLHANDWNDYEFYDKNKAFLPLLLDLKCLGLSNALIHNVSTEPVWKSMVSSGH